MKLKRKLTIDPEVARDTGLYGAAILNSLYEMLIARLDLQDGDNLDEDESGLHWQRLSIRRISALLPDASDKRTREAINKLIEYGYILKRESESFNRSCEYALTDKTLNLGSTYTPKPTAYFDTPAPRPPQANCYSPTPTWPKRVVPLSEVPEYVLPDTTDTSPGKTSVLFQEPVRTAWRKWIEWRGNRRQPVPDEVAKAYAKEWKKLDPEDVAWCIMYALVNKHPTIHVFTGTATSEKSRLALRHRHGLETDTFDVMLSDEALDEREERDSMHTWKND